MTKKVYTVSEFTALPDNDKLSLLYGDGVFVGKRMVGGRPVILFQLHGFYVEVFYFDYRKTVMYMETTTDVAIINPYLDQI